LWSVTKALQIPLDNTIKFISEIPYTISYVIRKRLQIDSLNELPKEKRPPELMLWDGMPEEIEEWLEKVYDTKKPQQSNITIKLDDIEG